MSGSKSTFIFIGTNVKPPPEPPKPAEPPAAKPDEQPNPATAP